MNNSEKSIIALFVGAILGAIAGILLAPDEGSKTRKKIKRQTDSWKKNMEDKWEEGADRVKEFKDSAADEVEKYSKKFTDSDNKDSSSSNS